MADVTRAVAQGGVITGGAGGVYATSGSPFGLRATSHCTNSNSNGATPSTIVKENEYGVPQRPFGIAVSAMMISGATISHWSVSGALFWPRLSVATNEHTYGPVGRI